MSTTVDFSTAEDLIIARIADQVTAAKSVATYAGQVEEILAGGQVKGFPFLTVMFTGEDSEPVDGPNYRHVMAFSVGIFAHSFRGQSAVRKDDEVGAYALVRAVKDALINYKLADDFERIVPRGLTLVFADNATVAYSLAVSVGMDQEFPFAGPA